MNIKKAALNMKECINNCPAHNYNYYIMTIIIAQTVKNERFILCYYNSVFDFYSD